MGVGIRDGVREFLRGGFKVEVLEGNLSIPISVEGRSLFVFSRPTTTGDLLGW